MNCDSCAAVMIQGVYCHETGCPNMPRFECYECGSMYARRDEAAVCCAPEDAMSLAPIGATVKRTEAYLNNKRFHRGSGWSERERQLHKEWEAADRAERWIVAAHIPPESEHNAGLQPAYKLVHPDNPARVSYSLPYDWTEVKP